MAFQHPIDGRRLGGVWFGSVLPLPGSQLCPSQSLLRSFPKQQALLPAPAARALTPLPPDPDRGESAVSPRLPGRTGSPDFLGVLCPSLGAGQACWPFPFANDSGLWNRRRPLEARSQESYFCHRERLLVENYVKNTKAGLPSHAVVLTSLSLALLI